MRTLFGFVLVGLAACTSQSTGSVPPPVMVASANAPLEPSQAPLDTVPPGKPAGPVVVINSEHVTIAGTVVGSVRELDRLARLQKVDALFDSFKADRAAWKAAHEAEAFPGVASLVVAPGTSGLAFASVFQTIAFAGFPEVHVAVSGRYYPTSAQVPGPPCGTPGERARLTRGLTVSVQEIDTVQGSASPAPIGAEGSSVTGRLAPEIIQKTIRASFGKIRPCYERALVADPSAKGSTSTRFVIGRDGTVSDARTTLSGSLPPEMSTCMEAAFRSFTFEAPSGGSVSVVYPIVFKPGE